MQQAGAPASVVTHCQPGSQHWAAPELATQGCVPPSQQPAPAHCSSAPQAKGTPLNLQQIPPGGWGELTQTLPQQIWLDAEQDEVHWPIVPLQVSQRSGRSAPSAIRADARCWIQATRPWRPPRPPRGSRSKQRHLSVRWLCLRPPEHLKPGEQQALEQFFREEPDLATGYDLLQRFRTLVARRDQASLEPWLTDAEASTLQPFGSLARGIRADRAAVDAALTTPWSNGPTEGQVHRLKLIKRQGYGRAKLDMLRACVVAS
jgi:transposase